MWHAVIYCFYLYSDSTINSFKHLFIEPLLHIRNGIWTYNLTGKSFYSQVLYTILALGNCLMGWILMDDTPDRFEDNYSYWRNYFFKYPHVSKIFSSIFHFL